MAETAFQASYRRKRKAKVKSSPLTKKGQAKPAGYLWAGFQPGPQRPV